MSPLCILKSIYKLYIIIYIELYRHGDMVDMYGCIEHPSPPIVPTSEAARRLTWQVPLRASLAARATHQLWVCLKMGYPPNNSDLKGNMMINQWVRDILFSDKPIYLNQHC